jgi:hypothetical protein
MIRENITEEMHNSSTVNFYVISLYKWLVSPFICQTWKFCNFGKDDNLKKEFKNSFEKNANELKNWKL